MQNDSFRFEMKQQAQMIDHIQMYRILKLERVSEVMDPISLLYL